MSERDLRQRKSVSREGEKMTENAKSNRTTSTFKSTAGLFSKVFLGLIVLIFAALLYNREALLQTVTSKGQKQIYLSADETKRDAVVDAFKYAWSAYERDAMGDDNYHPISKKGTNLTDAGGIGYTVVDTLDTIQLMGLNSEYTRARKWIANSLSFNRDGKYNTHEVTVRVLGGLLSAYHLSGGDTLYLERAKELADRLMPAFNTPFRLPTTEVNLAMRTPIEDPNNVVTTAEIASIQLELRYLSHLLENDEYWDNAENVMKIIKKAMLPSGLTSIFMGSESGQFLTSQIRLGYRGDAYYEYLLKQYLQTAQTEPVYREIYESTMTAVHKHLLKKSAEKNFTYAIELVPNVGRRGHITWNPEHKQDHLVCFIGGSLMLGATTSGATVSQVSVPPRDEELTEDARRDWKTGMALIETCMDLYKGTATGLAPQIVHFRHAGDREQPNSGNRDWYIKGARPAHRKPPYDARYMLRPEMIESLFLAYRLTGDEKYRQYGWDIFQSIEKHTRVETGGYATILNVDDVNSKLEDRMETFFSSETLKYLFLLFSNSNVIPLDKYVFNTEAHPLPMFIPHTKRTWSTSS
ncbi:Mannosyl-oligosaccharide 1,2-alpha-mannosidase MNS3 [Termitomyces sp. T112]|nr:Mannosyl-oligosaccharide 1,2-alpha-mannosidase MNS3 [Termitomyces sp. T112]